MGDEKSPLWTKKTWNVLYFEPILISVTVDDYKECVYGRAVQAKGAFLKEKIENPEHYHDCSEVIKLTKEYAELYDKGQQVYLDKIREEQFNMLK